jgi:hypothetical protein
LISILMSIPKIASGGDRNHPTPANSAGFDLETIAP